MLSTLSPLWPLRPSWALAMRLSSRASLPLPGLIVDLLPLGQLVWSEGQALLIDDYGHHPTEVAATLAALKMPAPLARGHGLPATPLQSHPRSV